MQCSTPNDAAAAPPYDVVAVRAQFPLLQRPMRGKRLAYLDNAATTQKPRRVIDAVSRFYEQDNANIHRAVYEIAERATMLYESARAKLKAFLGAGETHEAIFVRNATEAINLVASSFGRSRLGEGDEVLLTAMEHHANIVPWQIICGQTGASIRVLPMDRRGALILDELPALLTGRTRIVGVTHMSNALGTVNPIRQITDMAHARGIPVLVDGAQAVYHMPVDLQELGADFYAVSGHKMYGPTGIGALCGRRDLLASLPPYQGGGDMILSVTFEETIYGELPQVFEAGTPNIAGAIGLAAAVEFLAELGMSRIAAHERALLAYTTERLSEVPGLTIIGTAPGKASVISFTLDGVHPHDIGTILDGEGVAIRTGHHCAQPVMRFFEIPATARASFACYNTFEDIDALVAGLGRVREMFG